MPELDCAMRRKLYIFVAMFLIVAVAVILVAPSVDLSPTALRAWQAACALLFAIAATVRIAVAGAKPLQSPIGSFRILSLHAGPPNVAIFSCVLLC